MSAAKGNRPSVQNTYFDQPERFFPGQLVSTAQHNSLQIRGFPTLNEIVCGRAVVKGAIIAPNTGVFNSDTAPYTVQVPLVASLDVDFVGVAIRQEFTVSNEGDVIGAAASYAANTMATILQRTGHSNVNAQSGNTAIIAVLSSVDTVVEQPVYFAVNPTNAANIKVGEFHNVAGAGLILITGAVWASNALAGTVGSISI